MNFEIYSEPNEIKLNRKPSKVRFRPSTRTEASLSLSNFSFNSYFELDNEKE